MCVHDAAGAAAAAAPVRETDFPHRAAETGRDEGSPAEGAAGAGGAARAARIHSAAVRSDHTHTNKSG